MTATEARTIANRANAQKSTGPRTAEGKEALADQQLQAWSDGRRVVLPTEEAAEVERRSAAFEADYRPATDAGRALVRRAAILSVRLERCAVEEAAAIARNVRAAAGDFDGADEAEVDRRMETIGENPAAAVRELMRMPEGVDRMVGAWADLRADLMLGNGSRWDSEHSALAIHLWGRKVGGIGVARVEALSRAVVGDFSLLGEEDGAGLEPGGRREWARQAMLGLIDSAVEKLEAHRETLDLDSIAADRDEAASRRFRPVPRGDARPEVRGGGGAGDAPGSRS